MSCVVLRLRARRAYFFHLARRVFLPAVPLLISVAAILLGAVSPRLYMWLVVPLWYMVNVLVMVYPFSVLFPSSLTRYEPRHAARCTEGRVAAHGR